MRKIVIKLLTWAGMLTGMILFSYLQIRGTFIDTNF